MCKRVFLFKGSFFRFHVSFWAVQYVCLTGGFSRHLRSPPSCALCRSAALVMWVKYGQVVNFKPVEILDFFRFRLKKRGLLSNTLTQTHQQAKNSNPTNQVHRPPQPGKQFHHFIILLPPKWLDLAFDCVVLRFDCVVLRARCELRCSLVFVELDSSLPGDMLQVP